MGSADPSPTAISSTVALAFGDRRPDIPAFARQFGVSTAAVARVMSAFALMRMVGALPEGRPADRFDQYTHGGGPGRRGREQHPGRLLAIVLHMDEVTARHCPGP